MVALRLTLIGLTACLAGTVAGCERAESARSQSEPPPAPAAPVSTAPAGVDESSTAPSAALRGCEVGQWSTPKRIAGREGQPVTTRWPSVAAGVGGPSYIVGIGLTSVMFAEGDTVRTAPLAVLDTSGRNLGRPPGGGQFLHPRAVVDARGRLHVVWGEPSTAGSPVVARHWPRQKVAALWTAAYTPGSGWTKARPLLALPDEIQLRLEWPFASDRRSAGGGPWSMAVPVRDNAFGPGRVTVLRLEDDSLVTAVVPTRRPVEYASVAWHGTTAFLGYIEAEPPQGPADDGMNRVYVQASFDNGRTWRPRVRLSPPVARTPASEVTTLVAPDGRVHLVWQQEGTPAGTVIRHVWSSDSGRTWSTPDDLTGQGEPQALRPVMDSCGTLHLVYHRYQGVAYSAPLEYAATRAKWTAAQPLFPSYTAHQSTLALAADGRLLFVFVGGLQQAKDSKPSSTWYAELPLRQAPR